MRQDLPHYDVGNEDEETVGEAHELTVVTTSTMASSPIEAQSSCDKKEELLKALKERQLDIDKIKRLIEDDKIDINSVDQYSNTVLHLAIRKVENEDSKYVDFVKYLLKNKADIKARNMANETPFLLAARLNKHSVIRILAEQEGNEINAVNSPQCNTALHIAVLGNHPKVVKLLRTLQETLGLQEDKRNKSNLTPLDICLASDYPEVGKEVKEIMKSKREDLCRSSSQEGATAMCSDEASACEAPSERNQRERGKSSSKEDTTSLDSNPSSKDSDSDGAEPIPSSAKGNGEKRAKSPQDFHIHVSGTAIIAATNTVYSGKDSAKSEEGRKTPPKSMNTFERKESKKSPEAGTSKEIGFYPMKAKPRGICFVIKNELFSKESNLGNREGCDEDVKNLKQTFEWLNFRFRTAENLSAVLMFEKLRDIAEKDHSRYDCCVVCILTHGCAGAVYGVDGRKLPVNDIQMLFCGDSCPSLQNKPKLFFLNACREHMHGLEAADAVKDGPQIQDSSSSRVPVLCDFLIGYSTPDGFASWRHRGSSSWYIKELCSVLREYAEKEEIQHIMTEVNQRVSLYSTEPGGRGCMQIPSPVNHLRKKLWFFPDKVGAI